MEPRSYRPLPEDNELGDPGMTLFSDEGTTPFGDNTQVSWRDRLYNIACDPMAVVMCVVAIVIIGFLVWGYVD